MSPSWKTAAAATFSRRPLERSSSTCTSSPRARSASTTCEPMKPAPPVTSARMSSPSGGFEARATHCGARAATTPPAAKAGAWVRDQADQCERRHAHEVPNLEQVGLLDLAREHEHEAGRPAGRLPRGVVDGRDRRAAGVCERVTIRRRDLVETIGELLEHTTRSVPHEDDVVDGRCPG